ncbi:fibrinogen-related protein 3.2 [Plakobranchus ocellatus]|uniref:Fibrinogen-related protein 3.2 n=1 Tax=Plakobranchus ocellatus TaxID=259542 RepID=A0AAV3YKA8_9GAST|nr:fibrinogen-related protein 3.2 [Plakobranchus ocellatus]
MKGELLSTATLILLYYSCCCEGMKLILNRDIPMRPENRNTCGILRCEENVSPTTTTSSPDGIKDEENFSSFILNMTIFKSQPVSSSALEDKNEQRVLIASLTSEHPNITRVTNDMKLMGSLDHKSASMRLDLLNSDDCSSDFTCEVHGLDNKGRVFLSTSTLLQQKKETPLGDGTLDMTTSLQFLAQQLIINSLRDIEEKIEDKILSFERRVEGKMDSVVTDIRNQIHTLENRMEDKIGRQVDTLYQLQAKVSAMNEDDACSKSEDALDKRFSALTRELNDARENAVGVILDYIDARFLRSEMRLTNNLTDSITEVISSNDVLKGSLDKMVSSQMMSIDSIRKLETSIHNITSAIEPSKLLSQINNTMMNKNFESSMIDYLMPSDCTRGMPIPPSSYPFPHPVVYPRGKGGQDLPYLCDMFTDGGGWIVIQRRLTGNVDFYRDWATYKKGFGTFDDEFWLGNERIHALTSSGTWDLRVDLKYKGKKAFAQYKNFLIESESSQYRLRIGSYSGNAGDSLTYHNGQKFSTFDKDNDVDNGSCAQSQEGAWWYRKCDYVDLNSKWNGGNNKGLEWYKLAGQDSASFSEMKIRRVA